MVYDLFYYRAASCVLVLVWSLVSGKLQAKDGGWEKVSVMTPLLVLMKTTTGLI